VNKKPTNSELFKNPSLPSSANIIRSIAVAIVLINLSSCLDKQNNFSWPFSSNRNEFISLYLDSLTETDFQLYAKSTVKAAYAVYGNKLLWSEERKVSDNGRELLTLLSNCDRYGLFPGDFHEYELCGFDLESMDDPEAARLDLLLTDSYIALAHQLRNGTLNKKTYQPHELNQIDTFLIISLHKALKAPSIKDHLKSHEPDHYFYRAFKDNLKRLLAKRDSFPDDSSIESEILNVSVNLERWRWEYQPYPDRYIFVNIPSAQLYVFENDAIVLQSKVIVGTRHHPTPVLSSMMECYVIYPYWHVPHSIATRELLPEFKKDPSRLARQNFDVLDRQGKVLDAKQIDWKIYNEKHFPFHLRQREGIDNALGIIKFVFDNPYSVYLHDTNAKHLFNQKNRALSHGCVRVEKAEGLAFYLVKKDSLHYPQEAIQKWITNKIRREVSLRDPIPLYIRYFTYDQSQSFPDIYEKNTKLQRAIMSPAFSLILSDAAPTLPQATVTVSPASGDQ
jgi:L,D-transpeptidase YcbB